MGRLQKQFVFYIYIFLCVSHKVIAKKLNRDLTISVASPSLSHLPKVLGDNILSNPLSFVKSLIPKPGCGFNCGNEERMPQYATQPYGHKHQHNIPNPPPHSNSFHGNHYYQQWQEIRQPHPIYGAPYENNGQQQYNPPGNFYYNNMPQQQHYTHSYQYGQYQSSINPGHQINSNFYQQTLPNFQSSFNRPSESQNINYGINTPNNLEFIINQPNVVPNTGFNNPMTNQPNIIENIPNQTYNSGLNGVTTNIFENNPKQEYTNQRHLNQVMTQTPATNQLPGQPAIVENFSPSEETTISINSATNILDANPSDIIQIIPQQPTSSPTKEPTAGSTAIVETIMQTDEAFVPINTPTNISPNPFNPTPNIKEELNQLTEQSINPNEETNDFIYPDSARYIQRNNIDNIDNTNMSPPIDIRKRRSVK